MKKMLRVAVVGVQGDVEEHVSATRRAMRALGIDGDVIAVRRRGVVPECDAVIIPGGESTTISRLIRREGIDAEITDAATAGKPIMGTCAGLILLASAGDEQVERTGTSLLRLMDIEVRRNAFGRQRESFQCVLDVHEIGRVNAVFIRAPAITRIGNNVKALARIENTIVAARQRNILAFAFHPELSEDTRIHSYFLRLCLTAADA